MWFGRIRSAIAAVSSRNDEKLAMNGTVPSADRSLSASGSVKSGLPSNTSSAFTLAAPMRRSKQ